MLTDAQLLILERIHIPFSERSEKLIKYDMASCVEELHCPSYKWEEIVPECQNLWKKYQEK